MRTLQKTILFLFLFLAFFLFNRPLGVFAFTEGTDLTKEMIESFNLQPQRLITNLFADPDYTQPTNSFSPGQKVYYRKELSQPGDKQRVLRILGQTKSEIVSLVLEQSGTGPYLFTTSFLAPDLAGVYYVDVKIESVSGSVFSAQSNLNVGQGEVVEVKTSSQAESQTGGDKAEASASASASASVSVVVNNQESSPASAPAPKSFFGSGPISFSEAFIFIKEALGKLFSALAGLF